ncbi:MAG: hypothetical protein QXN00_00940, partial [Candidatus Aenigmatarchaeota archaeon]
IPLPKPINELIIPFLVFSFESNKPEIIINNPGIIFEITIEKRTRNKSEIPKSGLKGTAKLGIEKDKIIDKKIKRNWRLPSIFTSMINSLIC